MTLRAYRAVFMRGGTSKALIFRATDLPDSQAERDQIFLAAMGSPDPNGRQLDGMGGGLSSLSKVCVVSPPSHPEADVDYTFGQVSISSASVDYSANCGNMSSAIGPFAVDEGLVRADSVQAVVRIHNTNTHKLIVSCFAVRDGRALIEGDFHLPGVGAGAPIRLDFLDPAGAATGRLLPTGAIIDTIDIDDLMIRPRFPSGKGARGLGPLAASMVDAANPCVFVAATGLGLSGIEMPGELERRPELLAQLEAIRCAASIRMGLTRSFDEAGAKPSIPKIAIISTPQDYRTLSGETLSAAASDITVRMISIGQPHRAIPLTGAMCLAVAARIDGSIAHQVARSPSVATTPIRIAQPSGVTVVDAAVRRASGAWIVDAATVYRTARRLMDGTVYCNL